VNGALPGSLYIGAQDIQQLDGDYDGDYCIVTQDEAILEAVWQETWTGQYTRLEEGAKTRKCDPLEMLPFVAVEALGSSVGYITYLITSAVLNRREELVPELSRNLQWEVQGIKWSTRADRSFLSRVAEELEIPELFRQLNTDRKLFSQELPAIPEVIQAHPLSVILQEVMDQWEMIRTLPGELPVFKYLVHLQEVDTEILSETRSVVGLYNSWVSELIGQDGEDPDLSAPIQFIRTWGDSKREHRRQWATALWHIVHSSRSALSTGSAAFHAFQEEMAALIRDIPVPKTPGETEDLHKTNLYSIPCVGGHYSLPGGDVRAFHEKVRNLGRIVKVTVVPNELDPAGVDFKVGDFRLGSLPKDYQAQRSIGAGESFQAYISHSRRALYLHLVA
jgi:hypothetical protein